MSLASFEQRLGHGLHQVCDPRALEQLGRLGTNVVFSKDNQGVPCWGRPYMSMPGMASPVTEQVKAGTIEIWRFGNLTGDPHPIHFHLVNVQLLSRQPYFPVVDSNNNPVPDARPASFSLQPLAFSLAPPGGTSCRAGGVRSPGRR